MQRLQHFNIIRYTNTEAEKKCHPGGVFNISTFPKLKILKQSKFVTLRVTQHSPNFKNGSC